MPQALIASNDPEVLQGVAALFPEYQWQWVSSAPALLRQTAKHLPELIVIHQELDEDNDGPQLVALITQRAESRSTVVVGLAQEAERLRYYQAGSDVFEPLPLDKPRFRAHVEAAGRRRHVFGELAQRVQTLEAGNQALRDAERIKDDLTHMLVHDLKNPVTAILGMLDLVTIDSQRFIPPEYLKMLEMAREQGQHLLYLAANILDVRKMQEGKMRLDLKPLSGRDLVAIVSQALGDIGTITRERRLERFIPDTLPLFVADPALLRRILTNLVSNATKHTRRNGFIEVRARRDDGNIIILVRDDGEGIPKDDLPNIFNAFEQSRVTVHDRFDTGMGLTFCKLAIEEHGGKIWVESQRGKGSSFYFSLPLAGRVATEAILDDDILVLD
jgi:signal transduction histidine kinase